MLALPRGRPARAYAPPIAPPPPRPAAADAGEDDAGLVALAEGGDRAALDRLLRRHHDRIAGLCRRLAGNPADGADATQEALLAIVRGLHRYDGRAAFTTWAYRVATNATLDELRRRGRRPVPTDDDLALDGGGGGIHARTSADPGDQVADRLDVDAALATLSPDHRAAVVLRDLCTLDYAEIAEVLGIPPGTVRSRIARGRAALAEVLEDRAGNQTTAPDRPTPRT